MTKPLRFVKEGDIIAQPEEDYRHRVYGVVQVETKQYVIHHPIKEELNTPRITSMEYLIDRGYYVLGELELMGEGGVSLSPR